MMSNEEWDRKVEFLLNQQAKFDADMAEMKAHSKETDKKIDRLFDFLSSQSTIMFEAFRLTDMEIDKVKELQKLTEEALQRLITRFDRHLSEGHPGFET